MNDYTDLGIKMEMMLKHAYGQMQKWHWQTSSDREHRATKFFYEALTEKMDEFLECFMGQYGRLFAGNYTLKLKDHYQGCSIRYLQDMRKKIDLIKPQFNDAGDLQNIIDEIRALINRTIYLLTMNL